MGAVYEFWTVGSCESNVVPQWSRFLDQANEVIVRVIGELSTMSFTDDAGVRRNLLITDEPERLNKVDHIALYPLSGHSSIICHAEDGIWEFGLSVPVESLCLEGNGVINIIQELWSSLLPLNARYAAAGEELEVWEYSPEVLSGRMNPLEIPLCTVAIVCSQLAHKHDFSNYQKIDLGLMGTR